MVPSAGHCQEMGTASTMTSLVEALGMSLPGTASIPAVDARRAAAAEATGRRAVAMALEGGPRPSRVLTAAAFDNAITLLMALAGSTNAVLHLLALAGRVGVDLQLDRFDEISRRTPVLANVRPSGDHLIEDLFHSGGVPAVLRELRAATGRARRSPSPDRRWARSSRLPIKPSPTRWWHRSQRPLADEGGIAVLRGSLGSVRCTHQAQRCIARADALPRPGGRVRGRPRPGRADRRSRSGRHRPTRCWCCETAGRSGAPGMPEWGQLPIPAKLLRAGVSDMVRISDARMSGTAVRHSCAARRARVGRGRPSGDRPQRRSDRAGRGAATSGARSATRPSSARRMDGLAPPTPKYQRGYGRLYLDHVLQADTGCDFDFLRSREGEPPETDPQGLVGGPIGGW